MSTLAPAEIVYPESDGQPMAENTRQFECIVTLQGGLDELLPDDFVGADNFVYTVEGRPTICVAPDVYVALGRPKGHRGSYKQWEEDGVAPHVVFEVLSPRNRGVEMARKFRFYQRYGVQEYYIYDPDDNTWAGFYRDGDELLDVPNMGKWVSPLLGIRFDVEAPEMRVLRPDGEPFKTYLEQAEERRQAEAARRQADEARRQADEARRQADEARRQADEARRQADEARRQAEEGRMAAELGLKSAEDVIAALQAKLRAAGINGAT